MKLLITLISTFLFMIQIHINAEEASNHSSKPITVTNVTIDKLIDNYKSALDMNYNDRILSYANDFLVLI